jgi:type II secretory pathway component PulF
MPSYKWRGVEITGHIRTGIASARSEEHLDALLFKRGIALIKQKPARFVLPRPITLSDKIQLFQQLVVLVNAGVLIQKALAITAEHIKNLRLQEITFHLSTMIYEGFSLGDAMQEYAHIFDAVTIQLLKAGEQSGNLAIALQAIKEHLEQRYYFQRQLRSALAMPLVTISFFVLIALLIIVVMIPRFAHIFTSMGKQVPYATALLLSLSSFVTSWSLPIACGIGMLGVSLLIVYIKTTGKQQWDYIILKMPFIGMIIKDRFVAYTMQSFSFLLAGGEKVVPALQLIGSTIPNTILQKEMIQIQKAVAAGSSMSDAMELYASDLFKSDVRAMILVGQESGTLKQMAQKCADLYHAQVTHKLKLLTMLLQPLLLLLLGLLTILLICAVYIPIYTMSATLSL